MPEDRPDPNVEIAPARPGRTGQPIIGIGASAGGIDALQRFFPAVAPDSGMAYVVVLHLDPDHKSILAEVIARASRIPVKTIENDDKVEPNRVYVIPPNATLTMEHGRLRLAKRGGTAADRNSVDNFLVSLAAEQGDNAACVILSGTGSDGTLGLRAIKEHGGLTLAQEDAEYDGMMRSALATGLVDYVLPAEQLAAKLADYFQYLTDRGQSHAPNEVRQEFSDYLTQICTLLRNRTGHDFSDYKDRTIARRVQRRMQVLQIDQPREFIERLRKEPRELDLLFQDLLIGVTNFFRDHQAFAVLEHKVIPRLFEGKGADDTVRVWVAGCATGEEAYSLAMLLREHRHKAQGTPKIHVFASDIDEHALAIARTGRYPAAVAKDVSPERLERHFTREDGTYRVVSDLREICLFSPHNMLRDAPFSKIDLISCRNLLIYLNQELQDRVIPLLHYALRDEGYLFLGASENVARHSRLFTVVDKSSRIFRCRRQPERRLAEFPLSAPDIRFRAGAPPRPGAAEGTLTGIAERQMLDRYAPPFVVINADGEVLHASRRTGRYLELPAGAPNNNIFNLARRGMQLDLRAALHKASASGEAAVRNNIVVATNGGQQAIELIVHPLHQRGHEELLYMVVFQDIGTIKSVLDGSQETQADMESANVQQLEMELRATKERLQTTTEELESSNEELQSSNEELSSINEELQSSNEELETSGEELQSINEELQTVNAELNARVEELSRANSDLANLLENTQIATVFLDRNLTVKSFTPAAKDLFRLVESDPGRPIAHVRARFRPDAVEDDALRVLRTLGTIERQVVSSEGDARYIMRLLPYRTVDHVINGVVITFADVTRISAAEARISQLTLDLRNRVESLETLLDLVPVAIFMLETEDGQPPRANRAGARLLGEKDDPGGLQRLAAPMRLFQNDREVPAADQPLQLAARTGQAIASFEWRLVRADASAVDVMIAATPLFGEHGQTRGAIAAVVDISERKQAEHQQQLLLHELQHRVKNILATVSSLAQRMLKDNGSVEEFASAFLARLRAMGRMHDLLAQRSWQGADLHELIMAAVGSYATPDRSNIALDGPHLMLRPGTSATLGMVLHELATNAAKYGALGDGDGRLEIAWKTETSREDDKLHIIWSETKAKPASPPDHDGFGTVLVRRSVEYELGGTVEFDFTASGLRCYITFPLTRDVDADSVIGLIAGSNGLPSS